MLYPFFGWGNSALVHRSTLGDVADPLRLAVVVLFPEKTASSPHEKSRQLGLPGLALLGLSMCVRISIYPQSEREKIIPVVKVMKNAISATAKQTHRLERDLAPITRKMAGPHGMTLKWTRARS